MRVDASASEVYQCIKEEFQWSDKQDFNYLYAYGKCLQMVKLEDIENTQTWDCATIRALMGSGYLYISTTFTESSALEVSSMLCMDIILS